MHRQSLYDWAFDLMYVALVALVAHFQLYIIFVLYFYLTFSRVVLKLSYHIYQSYQIPPSLLFSVELGRGRTAPIGDFPIGLLPNFRLLLLLRRARGDRTGEIADLKNFRLLRLRRARP
jgi:hypothetical protein